MKINSVDGTVSCEIKFNEGGSGIFIYKNVENPQYPIYYTTTSIDEFIKKVDVIVPNKVVQVIFGDGTKEKAVCDKEDEFNLETAIAICISKKVMGGSSNYHKAIKKGLKVYQNQLIKERQEKEEKERIRKKKENKERKARERKQRKMEEKIKMYVSALKQYEEEKKIIKL